MPVKLTGSCHCGAVEFTVYSSTPVPYQLCVCSICRKVGGVGGSINLGGINKVDDPKLKFTIKGAEHISVYKAVLDRGTPQEHIASSERHFCSKCSAMLWLYDPEWPHLVHPFASAIDSPLQAPEKMVVVMADSKPDYVRLPEGPKDVYPKYGPLTLQEWHDLPENKYLAENQ
ncbi:Mss4-like protein [Mycena polygramma]|nr:Mss4-like protein [Mycena polygramma]